MNLENKTVSMFDGGTVKLLSVTGDDRKIDQRARASFVGVDSEDRTDTQVRSLVRHLMRKRHTSPFEFVDVEYGIHCPIFVFNQLVRHRTASINAASGRYGALTPLPVFTPPLEMCTREGKSKQKSSSDLCYQPEAAQSKIWQHGDAAKELQQELLNAHGMSEEMARVVLPQNQSTQFFFKLNLHNLFHFFTLRHDITLDAHAQKYTMRYVEVMFDLVKPYVPLAFEAWEDYVARAITFNRLELRQIASQLVPIMRDAVTNEGFKASLNKGEFSDFLQKLERIEREYA